MSIDPAYIPSALERLKATNSLEKYLWLQSIFSKVDVAANRTFQKRFTSFYRLGRHTPSWYQAFYNSFEYFKFNQEALTFPIVLQHLFQSTGRLEASFCSKLIATLDTTRPVLDGVLLGHLGLKLPRHGKVGRFDLIVDVYNQLVDRMQLVLEQEDARSALRMFDAALPEYAPVVSRMKKLDFILWQMRDKPMSNA